MTTPWPSTTPKILIHMKYWKMPFWGWINWVRTLKVCYLNIKVLTKFHLVLVSYLWEHALTRYHALTGISITESDRISFNFKVLTFTIFKVIAENDFWSADTWTQLSGTDTVSTDLEPSLCSSINWIIIVLPWATTKLWHTMFVTLTQVIIFFDKVIITKHCNSSLDLQCLEDLQWIS